ncbi:PC-esterase domain-containing protein 1A isoform X3 [Alligator mississippiensis]|uniref:PC-esterase domain-containing protein 1A isoform X3 n=1 Tax=Alligator mississippiensis TaxID=8496 RepID=UPI0028774A61|nr:PC-esterase domain-containing protein 1A isoform X3 [Alligator mississippiensis]
MLPPGQAARRCAVPWAQVRGARPGWGVWLTCAWGRPAGLCCCVGAGAMSAPSCAHFAAAPLPRRCQSRPAASAAASLLPPCSPGAGPGKPRSDLGAPRLPPLLQELAWLRLQLPGSGLGCRPAWGLVLPGCAPRPALGFVTSVRGLGWVRAAKCWAERGSLPSGPVPPSAPSLAGPCCFPEDLGLFGACARLGPAPEGGRCRGDTSAGTGRATGAALASPPWFQSSFLFLRGRRGGHWPWPWSPSCPRRPGSCCITIQRSVYKDLVLLLQKDELLSSSQLRDKGELSFEQDCLVEGGQLDKLHNGTRYREVRQYRTGHHLVRFYFLTRIYSDYLESILADFQAGPQPDLVIINSCIWDVSRYGSSSMKQYRLNLQRAFDRLVKVLPPSCLLVWNMALPLGHRVSGGFLVPEVQHLTPRLREDVIEGNFYSAMAAGGCGFDVLDLYYHFRFATHHRQRDGIHWNSHVHRWLSHLLLTHVADAWGVHVPDKTQRLRSFQDNHLAPDAWASSSLEPWAAPSRPWGSFQDNYPAPDAWAGSSQEPWAASSRPWVPETPRPPPCRRWEDEAHASYGLPAGPCPPPLPAAESSLFLEDTPLLPGLSNSGYISFDHSGAPGAACATPGLLRVPYPLGRPSRARQHIRRRQPLARTLGAPYSRPLPSHPHRY